MYLVTLHSQMSLREWIPRNMRKLPYFEPAIVDNTPHALTDEDLLEEVDANANTVLLRFYGRPATKRDQ